MGFQHMPSIVHEQASAKGGRVQKRKGLATLSDERKKEIATLGGKARYANKSRKGTLQTQDYPSDSGARVGDLHRLVDDDEQVQKRI